MTRQINLYPYQLYLYISHKKGGGVGDNSNITIYVVWQYQK